MSEVTAIEHLIASQRRWSPQATGQFTSLMHDLILSAKIISRKNIVVLGALNGNAYAGAGGDGSCFIAALEMDPIQIQIGDILAKSPDKQQKAKRPRRRSKAPAAAEPQIAIAKGGNIYIQPITKGLLNSI